MKSRRTFLGILASIGWLGFVTYLVFPESGEFPKMPPNEWGDFLAGCFAPLAFLWLVLGYLQQGDELRLSTEALRLQAEELKNSVQQQRELVEVSRQQVQSEREALAFERRLREDLSEPKFSVTGGGGAFRGDGHSTYNIAVTNTGHDATNFSARIRLLDEQFQALMDYPLLTKGATVRSSISREKPLEAGNSVFVLKFTDGLGRESEKTYRISRESEHPHAGLKFDDA